MQQPQIVSAADHSNDRRHIGVVVEDLEESTQLLSSMWGIGPWEVLDYSPSKNELMIGEPYKVKIGAARFGPTQLELLQPIEGKSLYSDFIKTHGEGLHHLAFSVPNWEEMASKLQEKGGRMVAGGVGSGRRWGYFHTSPGGVIVEFEELLDGKPAFSLPENPAASVPALDHLSVAVKDIEKTGRFLYSTFDIGPWDITNYNPLRDEITVGEFPMSLKRALGMVGPLKLELIQPVAGKTIWGEFIDTYGEGLHHLAVRTPNYDEMVEEVRARGGKLIFVKNLAGTRSCFIVTKPGGLILEFTETGTQRD